jgi:hypothetical protein
MHPKSMKIHPWTPRCSLLHPRGSLHRQHGDPRCRHQGPRESKSIRKALEIEVLDRRGSKKSSMSPISLACMGTLAFSLLHSDGWASQPEAPLHCGSQPSGPLLPLHCDAKVQLSQSCMSMLAQALEDPCSDSYQCPAGRRFHRSVVKNQVCSANQT